MKRLPGLGLILVATLLAGCATLSEQWHERVEAPPAKERDFPGDTRMVYFAAQTALKRLGFVLARSSLGDGVVIGHSAIQPGDPTRSARQLQMRVTLADVDGRSVAVGLLLIEHTEGGIRGGAVQSRVREHGLYESYFEALQQVINEQLAERARPRD